VVYHGKSQRARKILERYQQKSDSLYSGLVRVMIRWAVVILQRWQRFHFPERATGGWWWIERFRFEVLMRWRLNPTRRTLRYYNATCPHADTRMWSCSIVR